jgi:hypothetical protein
MPKKLAAIVALLVALTLATVSGAAPGTAKQRVAITMRFHDSTFTLVPFRSGALKPDSGTMTDDADATCHDVVRDGQKADVCTGQRWTLTGKQGTLTLRGRAEWVNAGAGGCGVAFGTWSVVRGTGVYAGLTGGGRSAYEAHCEKWYSRHEGLVTRSR